MSMTKKFGILLFAGTVAFFGLQLVDGLSTSGVPSFVSTADARVGRPLTPVSVAGVARRTVRRCANGTYNC